MRARATCGWFRWAAQCRGVLCLIERLPVPVFCTYQPLSACGVLGNVPRATRACTRSRSPAALASRRASASSAALRRTAIDDDERGGKSPLSSTRQALPLTRAPRRSHAAAGCRSTIKSSLTLPPSRRRSDDAAKRVLRRAHGSCRSPVCRVRFRLPLTSSAPSRPRRQFFWANSPRPSSR